MNSAKVFAVLCLCALVVACSNKPKVDARIIERKHLPNNGLQLKYTFDFNSQTYTDSFTVGNQVYNFDFVEVSIDNDSPVKSKPSLKK